MTRSSNPEVDRPGWEAAAVEAGLRPVKYEGIYLKDYTTVPALITGLTRYFTFYNNEHFHQSLGYRTPAEIHFGC